MGPFDRLNEVKKEFKEEADFFLFTDQNIETDDYKVIKVKPNGPNLRRESRKYKFHPYIYLPDYKHSIYIDGNMELLESPGKLINKYLKKHPIAVFKHPWRDCIYDEGEECRRLGLVGRDNINKQLAYLREMGYPKHYGLAENGVMIRRNCKEVHDLMILWDQMYKRFTHRDQLSFCFCAWSLEIEYQLIDGFTRDGFDTKPIEFKLHTHS